MAEDTAPGRLVTFGSEGRVARVQLQRPEMGNRITSTMMRHLIDALAEAAASGADVLVISAAGPDFSLGRDQHEQLPAGLTRADNIRMIVEANDALLGYPGVTVTSVRGRAFGFGCGVVLQSDVSVVADTAVLGFDEIRHGLAPGFVMSYIQDYVGPKRALDLILTGRAVSAVQAEQFGMVSRVVAEDALEASTDALVADLLASPPQLLASCKSYLREINDVPADVRSAHALDRTLTRAPS
jgi:methylglutaconyl-CoA hydratase